MSANAQQFARVVLNAFQAAGLFTVEQIVEAGGPSTTTITKLRKAAQGDGDAMPMPRSDTMRKIETAAGWPDKSATILWNMGTLPPAALTRSLGTGGVPVPEISITSSSSSAEDVDGQRTYRVRTIAIDRKGNESTLDLVYTPGSTGDVQLIDLMPVASRAHHDASRQTYMAGTRPRMAQGDAAHEPPATPSDVADLEPTEGRDSAERE